MESINAMRLNEKLKQKRAELGLSLNQLAERSNTSKSYLWELENRDTLKPSAAKLSGIAAVLNVTTEFLLDEKADLEDGHLKEAFFRKFNRLEDDDKKRIEDMIDLWGQKK